MHVIPGFVLYAGLLCCCMATQIHNRIARPVDNGNTVNMDITLDTDQNTGVYVVGYDVLSSCAATVNLHDYTRKLVAYKQVDTGRCYIKPATESLNETIEMIHDVKMGVASSLPEENWRVVGKILSPDEVELLAGPFIAEFCKDYEAHKLIQLIRGPTPRSARAAKVSPCWFNCGVCRSAVDSPAERRLTFGLHSSQQQRKISADNCIRLPVLMRPQITMILHVSENAESTYFVLMMHPTDVKYQQITAIKGDVCKLAIIETTSMLRNDVTD